MGRDYSDFDRSLYRGFCYHRAMSQSSNSFTGLPVLYSFRRCPYAMRARLAIAKANQAVELREVVLRDKPDALLSASPKGTVPVLVLQDGSVIDESYDVLRWAFEQHDPDGWLPADSTDLEWLVGNNDGEFKRNLDGYKYPQRHPERSREEYRSAGEAWLEDLNTRLTAAPYLAGSQAGAADIAIMPFIRQFVNTDPEWFASRPYDALAKWLDEWLQSELFAAVMNKYAQWQPGDDPVTFPERN